MKTSGCDNFCRDMRLERELQGFASEANFSLKALLLTTLLDSVVMKSSVPSEDFLRN